MIYLTEFNSFYKIGDVVLIEYWYNHMITPCRIVEKRGNKFLVSHNVPNSEIKNAPDELLSKSSIIDRHKG